MITIVDHPVVQSELTALRNKATDSAEFRSALRRIALILATEATRSLPVEPCEVETPLERTEGRRLSSEVTLLPILRAGLSMLESFQTIIPHAKVGYIGLKRNEQTLRPQEYYFNVPPVRENASWLILDPMIATGGSICAALRRLQLHDNKRVIIAALICAPEGIERIRREFEDVHIVAAALDRELNDVGFILPGLGDAGDRLNAT